MTKYKLKEYQLGCWGYRNGEHIHQVKCSVGFSF